MRLSDNTTILPPDYIMGFVPCKMREINPIWYILLVAFFIRLLVPITAIITTGDCAIFHSLDTGGYIKSATELLSAGRFTRDGIPELVRTPGYPFLLIAGILLGNVEFVTIVLQIFLSCLTVYVVFRVSLLLFEKTRVALLCAFLYAVEPLSILYTSMLLTETLFTFLNIIFLYFLLMYLKRRSLSDLLVSAVALSASAYVRPVNYFLPLVMTLVLLMWVVFKTQTAVQFIHALIFFVVSLGLIGLWQIRNSVETGYSGFSAISDINLYFYQGASVLAVQKGVSYYEMQRKMGYSDEEVYYLDHPEQRSWSRSERYRYMRREGAKILLGAPLVYCKIHVKGVLRALLDPGATDYLKLYKLYPKSGRLLGVIVDQGLVKTIGYLFREKPLVFWSNMILGLMLGIYIFSVAVAVFSKNFVKTVPIITALSLCLYLLFMSGGPHSLNRFRHPIMPIFCIFGGYGLTVLIDRLRKTNKRE